MSPKHPFLSRIVPLLAILGLLSAPFAAQAQLFKKTPEKLDTKIQKAGERLDMLQLETSTKIPPSLLARAQGIIIMHQFKLGLGFGGEGGSGVALVRNKLTGQWSPPAFIANAEGSYGFQIGGESTDSVLLLMDDNGLRLLTDGSMEIGVNLKATAGPVSGGGDAKLDNIDSPVLVYSSATGLYAGAAIEGGGIVPAEKANAIYYGMTLDQVLFQGLAKMTPSGQGLVNKINGYTRVATTAPNPTSIPATPAPAPVTGGGAPLTPAQ